MILPKNIAQRRFSGRLFDLFVHNPIAFRSPVYAAILLGSQAVQRVIVGIVDVVAVIDAFVIVGLVRGILWIDVLRWSRLKLDHFAAKTIDRWIDQNEMDKEVYEEWSTMSQNGFMSTKRQSLSLGIDNLRVHA